MNFSIRKNLIYDVEKGVVHSKSNYSIMTYTRDYDNNSIDVSANLLDIGFIYVDNGRYVVDIDNDAYTNNNDIETSIILDIKSLNMIGWI